MLMIVFVADVVLMVCLGAIRMRNRYVIQQQEFEQERDRQEQRTELMYVASDSPEVTWIDEKGEPFVVKRGSAVGVRGLAEGEESLDYRLAFVDDKKFIVPSSQLCSTLRETVLEKEGYANASAVLYESEKGLKIIGRLEKGDMVDILGYGTVLENGMVDRYQVVCKGATGYMNGRYFSKDTDDIVVRGDDLDYAPYPAVSFDGNVMPEEVRAVYLNMACIEEIDKYIEMAKQTGVNSFVLDIKESNGMAYQSEIVNQYSPTAYKYSYNTYKEYRDAVKQCRSNGIYMIGRIVTFRDICYAYDHPEETILDKATGEPYDFDGSAWLSPYSRNVWEYNVALALEAVKDIGFNEIQFDYARFPRNIEDEADEVECPGEDNETRTQAITRFMMYATDELHRAQGYVSCDVFYGAVNGEQSPYGHYWSVLSNVLDVISPMVYPDSFDIHDYGIYPSTWENPDQLLYAWGGLVERAQVEAPSPARVRCWIQGFDTYKEPEVEYDGDMVTREISGLHEAGLYGFMVWNVDSSLDRYASYRFMEG